MSRRVRVLARKLHDAWQRECGTTMSGAGHLQNGVRAVLHQALDEGLADAVLHRWSVDAQPLSDEIMLIQRETERLAGLASWENERSASCEAESILLAIPCAGAAGEFVAWLEDAAHASSFASLVSEHLCDLLGVPPQDLIRVAVSDQAWLPARVAALTADARRRLLRELLEPPDALKPLRNALVGHAVVPRRAHAPLVLEEGLLAVAAIVRTGWGQTKQPHQTDRLWDVSQSQVDAEWRTRTDASWHQRLARLSGFPALAFVPAPTAINDALLSALHAHLVGARLNQQPEAHWQTMLSNRAGVQTSPILHVRTFPDAKGNVVIEAQTALGQPIALRVPGLWAMVEGEHVFQQTLMDAFDLGHEEGLWAEQPNDPDSGGDLVATDPREWVGDHPAWSTAMPPAGRIH